MLYMIYVAYISRIYMTYLYDIYMIYDICVVSILFIRILLRMSVVVGYLVAEYSDIYSNIYPDMFYGSSELVEQLGELIISCEVR